jgi:hypothetical protein
VSDMPSNKTGSEIESNRHSPRVGRWAPDSQAGDEVRSVTPCRRTGRGSSVGDGPAHERSGQTIAPGSRDFVVFFLPGNTHVPKDIVVLPYGSNAGRMVWTVAGCPTLPRSCLGRFHKLGVMSAT